MIRSKLWHRIGLAVLALTPSARGQCPGWSANFGPPGLSADNGNTQSGFTPAVYDQAEFQGALYVGGKFGGGDATLLSSVARWNGTHWADVAGGVDGQVNAMRVFDDGSGSALYVAGSIVSAGGSAAFSVARWNGTSWSAVGNSLTASGTVHALEVHDDGTGPALYAAGVFTLNGASVHVARWNGTVWTALPSPLVNALPLALASFDAGAGARLYVAGDFNLFRSWDGVSWSTPPQAPAAFAGRCDELVVADLGNGPRLLAGGAMSFPGNPASVGVVAWDGATWAEVGTGSPANIRALALHDDGSGPKLYAGGAFQYPQNLQSLARFDGTTWQSLDASAGNYVFSLMEFDDGYGLRLVATGHLESAGTQGASGVAAWDGTSWSPLGDGDGTSGPVIALATFDDGNGRALYAGGTFKSAGTTLASAIARFDGTDWSALGSGISIVSVFGAVSTGNVFALCEYTAPAASPALFAGGSFNRAGGNAASSIARWDGATWSPLGLGVTVTAPALASVTALCVHDDGTGPALYVGGTFTAAGGSPASNIARWDGGAWSTLGSGTNGSVRALCVFDDGSGAKLVAAGDFTQAGGAAANSIAVWNGNAWSTLGSGAQGLVGACAVFDDGSGTALYSSGYYTLPGGTLTKEIARWRNGAWESVGTGITATASTRSVKTLLPYTDALGSALVVGGLFTEAGGMPAPNLARWDGANWSGYGSGAQIPGGQQHVRVNALCAWDDGQGGGADLYAAGVFSRMDDKSAANIAKLRACGPQATSYCAGDGSAAACPCGNTGATGYGCANPSFASGAELTASGVPSLSNDTISLTAASLPNSTAFFVQGAQRDNGGMGTPFYDGVRCVSGALVRLGLKAVVANSAAFPGPTNLRVSVRGAIPPAGATRHYQVLYRSAAPMFCPPSTANWTNGLTLTWYP